MNPTPKTRRRGKQPKFVPDPVTGDPIAGLRYWETRKKYFVYELDDEGNNTTTRIILGDDYTIAKYKFEQIMAERAGEEFTTATKPDYATSFKGKAEITFTDEVASALEAGKINPADIIEGISITHTDIPDSFCIDRVRTLILEDVKAVSKRIGFTIKIIGDVKPSISMSLDEVFELFVDNRDESLEKQQLQDATNYWNQFCKCVKVKTVAGLEEIHFTKFNKYVLKSNYAPRTKKNIFNIVASIFRHTKTSEIRTILGYCEDKLKRPNRGTKRKPQKFDKAKFKKFYELDDAEIRLILLLALNCGMKQTAIANLKLSDMNLKDKTLSKERHKTGFIRSAVLWKETVKAVKDWLKVRTYDSDYLFLTEDEKGKWKKCELKDINRVWRRAKRATGIEAEFRHFRDAVQNIPVQEGIEFDLVRILLGHKIDGMANDYTERNPEKTRTAVRAIHKYYFAKK